VARSLKEVCMGAAVCKDTKKKKFNRSIPSNGGEQIQFI
jgi:hypothetical protein